ncbi:MAG: hypothetical protein M1127_03475 [Patescibacteria group bacterium]|nr:hypothetical protein [Patescibacteria group bacterium]
MLKKDTIFLIIVIVVGLGAIAAGAWQCFIAPYLDEVRVVKMNYAEQTYKVAVLESERAALEQQLDKLETLLLKNNTNPTSSKVANNNSDIVKRSLRVISPNGGETLCIGEKITIKIDIRNVEVMSLVLVGYNSSGESYNYIGDFSGLNESGKYGEWALDWQTGDFENQYSDLNDNIGYKLKVESADGGVHIEDLSDKIFHIISCQG